MCYIYPDDPLFWQNTGDDTENRFPCIFFKVVNIKGKVAPHGNYIMDKDQTTLIEVLFLTANSVCQYFSHGVAKGNYMHLHAASYRVIHYIIMDP